MKLEKTWTLSVFGVCFALLALVRFRTLTSDSFLALTGGREVSLHGLPRLDHLTVQGRGHRWIDQQWLAQWLMYRSWKVGGYGATALLAAVLVAAAFGMLTAILIERGAAPRRSVKWALFAFAVALPDLAIRAQEFVYPLFVGLLWVVLRDVKRRTSPLRLAVALALLVAWANLHGSVLIGASGFAAYCAFQAIARRESPRSLALYFLALAGAILSPLATPYGFRTLHYYTRVAGDPAIRRFSSEWQPPTSSPLAAAAFFALVLALGYVLLVARRLGRVPSPGLLAPVLALVGAGFIEVRWETWAALLAVVFATDTLNVAQPSPPLQRGVPVWARGAIAAFAAAGTALLLVESAPQFERNVPRIAIARVAGYMQAHPRAKVLGDDRSSTVLLWLHPELAGRVGLDERLEVYPARIVDRWRAFILGRRPPDSLVSSYDVLLASKENHALTRRLLSGRSRVLYRGRDGVAVLNAARTG